MKRSGKLLVLSAMLLLAPMCLAAPARRDGASAALAAEAVRAMFVTSNLQLARSKAAAALRINPANRDALLVEMEAAALQADTAAELEAAMRLCELRAADPRINIAAARILNAAGNTAYFRAIAPRVRALVGRETPQVNYLRASLVAAASEGLPGESVLQRTREAGMLTDWRMAGPFGRFPNVDFDRAWRPERDGLAGQQSGKASVEQFRFEDGMVTLPEYFHRGGVFYAAAELVVPTGGQWRVRVESGGTVAMFVNGKRVLTKDARFRAGPEIVSSVQRMAAGRYRLLVRFLPSAVPFRVAVVPFETRRARKTAPLGPAAAYIAAAERYWLGAYGEAVADLNALRLKQPSAAVDFLLALAWWRQNPNSAEEVALLHSVLERAPSSFAAENRLAARAYSDERLEDALERVRRVLKARPDSLPAQELRTDIAMRLGWHPDAVNGMEARLRLQPTCATLHDAARLFATLSQLERTKQTEARMRGCAPGSLTYAEALSDGGHHGEAARELAALVAHRPLDRNAHAMLVGELRLAGDFEAARRAAHQLYSIAPNSERFLRLAEQDGTALLEDDFGRGPRFAAGDAFYTPYRRDPLQVIKDTADRYFSGGAAVMLLNDRVVRIAEDGSASVYVHKLIRVLTREGIEQYGEVALPRAAQLLELRTIKSDGGVFEPEFTPHKATLSMPSLAAGDVIEQEYVVHHAAGIRELETFRFGSFAAPMLSARLVLMAPARAVPQVIASAAAPAAQSRMVDGMSVRTWERDDIAQSAEEPAMPRGEQLPSVRIVPLAMANWPEVQDHYRDLAIDATRVGSRAQQVAETVARKSDEEKARRLYRLVTSTVRGGSTVFSDGVVSAEETLAGREGSRTAALLALARAAGVEADLVLARETGSRSEEVSLLAFTRPLVRFRFAGTRSKAVFVDAETEGLTFGALPPALERDRALLVPIPHLEHGRTPADLFVKLQGAEQEQSVARGEVALNQAGDISATVEVTLGSWRGAQMRSILRAIPPSGRQHFFEQLAMRIFPGATGVGGEVRHEADPEQPLELWIRCRSPRFLHFNGRSADLGQLVPALGLRKLYAGAAARRFALYLETPFVETTTFRVRLPAGVRLAQATPDLDIKNQFGRYAMRFRQPALDVVEITRSFHIPVQLVPPEDYPSFNQFAAQVDEAERQRLTLERVPQASAAAR